MEPVPLARFEALVGDALDAIPDELWAHLDNVVVLVDEVHITVVHELGWA